MPQSAELGDHGRRVKGLLRQFSSCIDCFTHFSLFTHRGESGKNRRLRANSDHSNSAGMVLCSMCLKLESGHLLAV
jgi:hypothetical protein